MCFIFHKWNKWSRPVHSLGSGRKHQYRECANCGVMQSRRLPEDYVTPISEVNKVLNEVKENEVYNV